eukprot:365679-Chlamydomonas_euryale.AAC.26
MRRAQARTRKYIPTAAPHPRTRPWLACRLGRPCGSLRSHIQVCAQRSSKDTNCMRAETFVYTLPPCPPGPTVSKGRRTLSKCAKISACMNTLQVLSRRQTMQHCLAIMHADMPIKGPRVAPVPGQVLLYYEVSEPEVGFCK